MKLKNNKLNKKELKLKNYINFIEIFKYLEDFKFYNILKLTNSIIKKLCKNKFNNKLNIVDINKYIDKLNKYINFKDNANILDFIVIDIFDKIRNDLKDDIKLIALFKKDQIKDILELKLLKNNTKINT